MKVNNKTRDEMGSLCQKIADLSELIGEIRDAEQEKFDSRSEKWQEGDKGQEAQTNIDELDSLAGDLQEIAVRVDSTFDPND